MDELPEPPALPARLTGITWFVGVGTVLWLLASVILLLGYVIGGRPLDDWFTTSIAGWLLGLIGFGIMGWQRAARRRGSRGAQDGI